MSTLLLVLFLCSGSSAFLIKELILQEKADCTTLLLETNDDSDTKEEQEEKEACEDTLAFKTPLLFQIRKPEGLRLGSTVLNLNIRDRTRTVFTPPPESNS